MTSKPLPAALAEWIDKQGLELEDKDGDLWLTSTNEMSNEETVDAAAAIWANPKVRAYIGKRRVYVPIWSIDELEVRTLLRFHKKLFAAQHPGQDIRQLAANEIRHRYRAEKSFTDEEIKQILDEIPNAYLINLVLDDSDEQIDAFAVVEEVLQRRRKTKTPRRKKSRA